MNQNSKLKIRKPILGTIVAIVVGVIMFFGAFYLATNPLRQSLANQFLSRGDKFLNQKKYVSAIVEYKKAEFLAKNKETESRINLADQAQEDVDKLENFYREQNNISQLELYNQVRSVPDSSYDLVTLAKYLIENNEAQMAVEAAATATEMDKEYRDAWLYLGLSNLAVAKNVELTGDKANTYIEKGKEALSRAKQLDPSYAATNDILKQVQ